MVSGIRSSGLLGVYLGESLGESVSYFANKRVLETVF